MAPISVQLYSLRNECAQDFFGVLRSLAETGYAGVEFAGLNNKTPKDVAAVLAESGLKASSAHIGLPTQDNIGEIVETAGILGYKDIITGFMGEKHFGTADLCHQTAAVYQEAAELAKANGLRLGIHNHWDEFADYPNGENAYDILMNDAPSIFGELDVYWAATAGKDPADVIKKHANRLSFLHIKDGPLGIQSSMTAVGSGALNIPQIIQAADPSVLQWVVVELDRCETDMMQAVKDSYKYLVGSGLAKGNK